MNPYLIAGGLVVGIGLAVGSFFFGTSYADSRWEAKIAAQKAVAAALLANAKDEVERVKDANVIETRNMDEKHAAEIAVIVADRDASAKRLADGVRRFARSGASCPNAMPGSAANTASPAGSAAGGEDRLYQSAGSDLSAIGINANTLAATVRECVTWVNDHGRLQ